MLSDRGTAAFAFLSFRSLISMPMKYLPLHAVSNKSKSEVPSVQTPSQPFAPALRQCHCTLQDSVLVGIKQSHAKEKREESPSLVAPSSQLLGQKVRFVAGGCDSW